jgi:hypothetical protein
LGNCNQDHKRLVETNVIIIEDICNQFKTTLTSLSDSETQKPPEITEYSIYKPLSRPGLRLVLFGDLFSNAGTTLKIILAHLQPVFVLC